MNEKALDSLRRIADLKAESSPSRALNRIAQSLDLPVGAFYGPDHPGVIERDTERLLALVGIHLRRLDPGARTRFGEAVLTMVGPGGAEDGRSTAEKAACGDL
ncbi:hypothetical protein MKK88_11520 [Methylobacterium sp. E-005]|uniref:hypothetical protein n=1 Tax=Methylobacterium sp. E-005 TaxID=2836549 RepID=UPI001FB98A02|nr:hypothetical protein [Methylobacterium sp. E-005]MCJ2086615.1 hypothetical protein [Methylobacterium sp. E-005]